MPRGDGSAGERRRERHADPSGRLGPARRAHRRTHLGGDAVDQKVEDARAELRGGGHEAEQACIPVSRRPRRAIWTASARGTTAFITAAESETRRRVSVETWLDGDIATGRAPAPERARRYEPTEENPNVARCAESARSWSLFRR